MCLDGEGTGEVFSEGGGGLVGLGVFPHPLNWGEGVGRVEVERGAEELRHLIWVA